MKRLLLIALLIPSIAFAGPAEPPARPPFLNRLGTSIAHGFTALRIGYSAIVQDFSLATCTVTATGTVTFTLFSFQNRSPFPSTSTAAAGK